MVKKRKETRKSDRVSTGIAKLDTLIEGGFEKNSTNLVIGDGGSGKTIFGVQFLIEGIKNNEKVLYITFEEKRKEFFLNMQKIGFNLDKLEKDEKFFFIEYTPEKVKTMLDEGGGLIEVMILKEDIKRVVIDSMTSFGLLFSSDIEKRQSILALFNILKKWDCTSLLTFESYSDKNIAPDILEFESDSIIVLSLKKEKVSRERYLEVIKMRGTKHSSKTYKFTIGKGGIKL